MDAAGGHKAMITQCPSCRTHFRVNAQQLAARAGQVRCGKCARVFDALEYLTEEIAPARAPGPDAWFEANGADTAATRHAPEPADAETVEIRGEAQQPAVVGTARAPPEPAESPERPKPEAETPQTPASKTAMREAANSDTEATVKAVAFHFGPVATAEPAKTRRRWLWLAGALLLLLLLLAQAAFHFRGTIVLLFPQTKSYATALCASLGCELPLPRRIDLMSIEASDLQADTNNSSVMVLSATLKNRAIFGQQYPLLELTLTDAQDQPLVRRVLTPQDYLGRSVNTEAGFGANTEIGIKVFIESSQIKATGYRLYLFYP
jgi:predicted Zn finger-like uncharacterized protein